ncbi:MAG: glycosyltransferase [Planctomycetota bacterium]
MAPRRLLFVSEKFPYPVDDGGQIRTYHLLKSLAAEFPVTLIGLAPPSPSDVAPIRELGVDVRVVGTRASSKVAQPWYLAQALFTRAPYPLRKNFSRAILAEIRRELATGTVGFLHMNQIDAVQYVPLVEAKERGVRTVFDTLNVLTTMYQRLAESTRDPLRKAYCVLQWQKMFRFEQERMRGVDRVLVCSDVEASLLRTWGLSNVMLVPNGVDTAQFAPRATPPARTDPRAPGDRPFRLVFTGGMDYLPNQDGIRWFVTDVLPRIEARLPHVELCVVGKNPPAALTALARPGRVVFTGRVDDVRPYTAGADLFVVPLRIGGGTRLKILEALSMRVPVASTTVGAEGLAVRAGHDLLIADTPEAFADAALEIARSPARGEELADHGRELVLARYDWKSVTASLVEFYRTL